MSRTTLGEVEYRCFNDCVQTGCPGHKLRVVYYGTADVVEVYENGEPVDFFDPNRLDAIIRGYSGKP